MNSGSEIIDLKELNERIDGDMGLFRELAEIFSNDSETMIHNVKKAVDSKDAAALAKAAHTLKGSVANFSAQQAFESALKLEKIGKSGDLSQSKEALDELEKTINILVKKLNELASQEKLI